MDGLRGVAAVVVLIHHLMLSTVTFSPAYAPWAEGTRASGWAYALTYTPLHIFWDGPAAVLVFFVLSGFVLTLAFNRTTTFIDWLAYYPSRLARLYLPVAGSVALAAALAAAFPRSGDPSGGWWLAAHEGSLSVTEVVQGLTLLGGTGWLNSPLWSLQWEVWFSLLLPGYLVAARRIGRHWPLAMVACVVLAQLGEAAGSDAGRYLPVFGIGVLAAVHDNELRHLRERLGPRLPWALIALSILLLEAPWYPIPLPVERSWSTLGAALLVLSIRHSRTAARALSTRLVVLLGTLSFSLYLTHEPLLVSLATVLPNMAVAGPLAFALSFALAELFFRVVERPSHRVAQRIALYMRPKPSAAGP